MDGICTTCGFSFPPHKHDAPARCKPCFKSTLKAILATFLLILGISLLPTRSFAGDAVSFIVQHNPELRQMEAQSKWYNHISVTASARSRYGQSILSTISSDDTEIIEATGDQPQSSYDLTVTASMPLICPKEAIDLRLKYLTNMRTLRNQAASAIAKYQALITYLSREESIIQDMRNELDWLKQRESAALEETKAVIAQTLEIKQKIRDLDTKRPELQAALEEVLSFVGEDDRPKLLQILRGI